MHDGVEAEKMKSENKEGGHDLKGCRTPRPFHRIDLTEPLNYGLELSKSQLCVLIDAVIVASKVAYASDDIETACYLSHLAEGMRRHL